MFDKIMNVVGKIAITIPKTKIIVLKSFFLIISFRFYFNLKWTKKVRKCQLKKVIKKFSLTIEIIKLIEIGLAEKSK